MQRKEIRACLGDLLNADFKIDGGTCGVVAIGCWDPKTKPQRSMKCGQPEVRTPCVLSTVKRSHAGRWMPVGCQDAHNTRSVVVLSGRVVGFNASACRQCAIHCRSAQKGTVSKFPGAYVEVGYTSRLAIYGPQRSMVKVARSLNVLC